MLRQHFHKLKKIKKDKITWRSHEVTRIEAFSDAVFAFAVSLLIISLEVPKTSKELFESLKGLFPFAICFIILFWVWRAQNRFFRRFGLHDTITLGLNGFLLCVVLGYVYPLKFLFSSMLIPGSFVIQPGDSGALIVLYNSGFAVIGLLFSMMYYNAYLKRDEIKLTQLEAFETVNVIWGFGIPASVAFIALFVAWFERHNGDKVNISFSVYALLGILMPLFDRMRNKQFKKKFGNAPIKEPEHNGK